MEQSRSYELTYIMRIWCNEDESGVPHWRFTLESATTGERRGFGNLDTVIDYIKNQIAAVSQKA